MVVIVVIDGESPGHLLAEKRQVSGIPGDDFRMAGATDMGIETNHPIGSRHDQV